MKLTIFTPTYNRANVLHRVFDSLKAQTFKEFEWLIIDDGSTDETNSLIREWQASPCIDFPIRYIWQENQHKKAAHNRAVWEARGDLFLVFDSDDRCVPEAFERFLMYWNSIPQEEQKKFVGVSGLCKTTEGNIVGECFPCNTWMDSDFLEMRYRYHVRSEKWCMMQVHILREYSFRDDLPGYVPEGTIWSAIARTYKTRFFNEALRIYYFDTPGIMLRKGNLYDVKKNSVGHAYGKEKTLSDDIQWFLHSPVWFYLEAARLFRFWIHTDRRNRRSLRLWPVSRLGKFLLVIAVPLGLIMWLCDSWRSKNST